MKKSLIILGSTGSIGCQTLNIVNKWPKNFKVEALAAGSNVELLEEQARKFNPKYVSVGNYEAARELNKRLTDTDVKVLEGEEGLLEVTVAPGGDLVVNALVGFRGLKPTIAALEENKSIALANKETLVAGGDLVMELARKKGLKILPVDSEHSAIFQCFQGEEVNRVEKIILTASGGPFRGYTREELSRVSLKQALKHPNWSMGKKITIDSATLMNKGLEVLEARVLFGMDLDRIAVIIHPQSIIHSMVEFEDGAVMAQMGIPDMALPIQYALTYPHRWHIESHRLDWRKINNLNFEEPDMEAFPCLEMAYRAGEAGGTMPAVLNAANEEAVALYLKEQISFLDIPRIIERVMNKHKVIAEPSLEEISKADREVRNIIRENIE
ncbi:MAG: 1-deoxy-D-xylulose-5-phosphate reductoisomerase [Candidatus Syntrophonatronum acetioxidans]|uniref:1-deoxy-D-xylulose 5-phosphate reductoisomerase n=1 Tax=Candidatus Syntrophonatronum acetioxidans TaxID=1795816 RepID=A0A424YEB5_9FIRM|nr:MAG: 1-deoxy-D-xylulose-5-phosphate reductoisomerase [Candidatus Syntrophonatronum acetioxidans]